MHCCLSTPESIRCSGRLLLSLAGQNTTPLRNHRHTKRARLGWTEMDVLDLGQNLTPVSRDSSTISNQVKCSLVGWPILGCNKVPNRTDAAAASEKPRGDVRNWAHCADEDEAISGPNRQPNSIVTADRLRCGARVCRHDAELFCNTSAVRQHYSKSGVGHVRSSKQGCAGLKTGLCRPGPVGLSWSSQSPLICKELPYFAACANASEVCHQPTRAGAATFMGAEAGRPRSRTRSVMVDVACLAARTVGVPEATMASTLRATRLGGQLRQMVGASVCPAILDSEIAALAPTGSRAAAQRERRSSCAAQRRSCGPAT